MRDRGHFNSGIERSAGAGIKRRAGQNSRLMRRLRSALGMAGAGLEAMLRPGLQPLVLKGRDRQPGRRVARCRIAFVSGQRWHVIAVRLRGLLLLAGKLARFATALEYGFARQTAALVVRIA